MLAVALRMRGSIGANVQTGTRAAIAPHSAFAVGPNYVAPVTSPAVLKNAQSPAFLPQTPDAAWRQEFDDPELDALMRRALSANLDLRSAYDRVKAARAVFVERKLDYAPHVQLDGAYSRIDEQQPGFGTNRYNIQGDSLGFDAAWEIDLFGHVRRSVEAARADLGAERANYRDAEPESDRSHQREIPAFQICVDVFPHPGQSASVESLVKELLESLSGERPL